MCNNTQEKGRYCEKCQSPLDDMSMGDNDLAPVEPADEFEIEKPSVMKYLVMVLVAVLVALIVLLVAQLVSSNEGKGTSGNDSASNQTVDSNNKNNTNKVTATTEAPTKAVPTETTTAVLTQIQYSGMEGVIQELLNKNFEFISFYQFGTLSTSGYKQGTSLEIVNDSRMSRWEVFMEYVQTLYASSRADAIIWQDNKYWGEYKTYGQLYAFPENITVKGYTYPYTWEVFEIEIKSPNNNSSSYSFTVTDMETGYQAEGKIVYEGNRWLLEKEVY